MKKLMVFVSALALLTSIGATTALANNGQAIGKDPLRLALTQCSNAGLGNGPELESGLFNRSVLSDCLYKKLGSKYTKDEVAAIFAQSTCVVVDIRGNVIFFLCEVDPGNSAAHNANNA